jgi:hypothetical protein
VSGRRRFEASKESGTGSMRPRRVLHETPRNTVPVAVDGIEVHCRAVARHYHGARGVWVYKAFDWVNETLHAGRLPYPLIVLGLTAHGRCLGWTRSPIAEAKPPTILLHPSIWGGTEKEDPWRIPQEILGSRYAFDVLIHEAIHISVNYLLGGAADGESSHNNPAWIAEVNRIAPLVGLDGVQAAMSKVKREGKKVRRVSEGTIPFFAAATFPYGVRRFRGELGYYRDRSPLPFEPEAGNVQLRVTPAGDAGVAQGIPSDRLE